MGRSYHACKLGLLGSKIHVLLDFSTRFTQLVDPVLYCQPTLCFILVACRNIQGLELNEDVDGNFLSDSVSFEFLRQKCWVVVVYTTLHTVTFNIFGSYQLCLVFPNFVVTVSTLIEIIVEILSGAF